jgi:hypothetical protein
VCVRVFVGVHGGVVCTLLFRVGGVEPARVWAAGGRGLLIQIVTTAICTAPFGLLQYELRKPHHPHLPASTSSRCGCWVPTRDDLAFGLMNSCGLSPSACFSTSRASPPHPHLQGLHASGHVTSCGPLHKSSRCGCWVPTRDDLAFGLMNSWVCPSGFHVLHASRHVISYWLHKPSSKIHLLGKPSTISPSG